MKRVAGAVIGQTKALASAAESGSSAAMAGRRPTTGPLAGLPTRPTQQQCRPLQTVVWPTQVKNGKVTDPGHIQFQTSEAERARYPGLSKAIGRSPATGAALSQDRPVEVRIPGQPPATALSRHSQAKPLGEDPPARHDFKGVTVIEHGELGPRQAAILKDAINEKPGEYDTVGDRAPNCVQTHNELSRQLGLTDKTVPRHATPQQGAALVANATLPEDH